MFRGQMLIATRADCPVHSNVFARTSSRSAVRVNAAVILTLRSAGPAAQPRMSHGFSPSVAAQICFLARRTSTAPTILPRPTVTSASIAQESAFSPSDVVFEACSPVPTVGSV